MNWSCSSAEGLARQPVDQGEAGELCGSSPICALDGTRNWADLAYTRETEPATRTNPNKFDVTDTGLTGEAFELFQLGSLVNRRVHGLCPMPRRITKAPKRAIEPSVTPPTVSSYLTTAEVAQRLRVSIRTVERLHEKRELTAYFIAGRGHRRFRADDVERLLLPDQIGEQQDADLDSFISTHCKKG